MGLIARWRIFKSNDNGFTLIEVMVSIVIVLVGLLGLVQMLGVTAAHNVKNQLRDEAVLLGEEQMAYLFSLPESKVVAFETISTVSRLRGSDKKYIITRSAAKVPTSNSYQMAINVGWTYKNEPFHHEVQAMRTFTDGK